MATVSPNFAEELVDYTITAGEASTKGTDIFYHELPSEIDLGPAVMMVIKDTGGTPSINSPSPDVAVQFLIRSNTWLSGRAKAGGLFTLFHAVVGITTTSYRIRRAVALQLPQPLGQDEQNRYLFSFNIMFLVNQLDAGSGDSGYGGHKDPYDQFETA